MKFSCPPGIIENYRKKRKHMKEETLMKTTHKLCLVFACLALLTFSGCTKAGEEPAPPPTAGGRDTGTDTDRNKKNRSNCLS